MLGRVCKLEPEEHGSNSEHGKVIDSALFIAGSNAARLLKAVEEALDDVALTIDGFVKVSTTALIGLAREGGADTTLTKKETKGT